MDRVEDDAFGKAPARMKKLFRDLEKIDAYVPTIRNIYGSDILATALRTRDTKLVEQLVKYLTKRAKKDDVGFMVPIAYSFDSLLRGYPETAIDALKKTCFIKTGPP